MGARSVRRPRVRQADEAEVRQIAPWQKRPEKRASDGVVLDAGAFIGFESRRDHVVEFLELCIRARKPLVTSAGVLVQVWRDGGGRQVPVAPLLNLTDVRPLDKRVAKLVGMVLGRTGTRDLVDAHIVLIAMELGWPVLTSDRDDLERLHDRVVVFDA